MTVQTRRFRRALGAGATSIVLCTSVLSHPAWSVGQECRASPVRVTLPGEDTPRTVRGTLCTPGTWASGPRQVDVLVHGGTYSRRYWDLASGYSFADLTVRQGRAAYYFDQLGSGTSDKPPSSALTLATVASVLHQVIRKMRTSTRRGGHGFPEVNVVGHSLGSYTAIYTAGKYRGDMDRLVVTGALHVPEAVENAQQGLATSMAPASVDPKLSKNPRYADLDQGYLTTNPGARRQAFYYPRGAEAAVIARDERAKDVMSATHAGAAFQVSSVQPPSANIAARIGSSVDVLVVVGQQDSLMCTAAGLDCTSTAAVRRNERGYFRNVDSLSVVTVPNTGHSLALHRSRTSSFASINRWIRGH